MPKADLGVKRVCPETGKKFYDLNKDPIVSPFTGNEYPLSYFEEVVAKTPKPTKEAVKEEEEEKAEEANEDEDDDEADTPELDEVPLDLGEDDEDDDAAPKAKATPGDDADDLEGFSDEESSLDDDDEDDSLLIDDEDDDLGGDIAVGEDEDDS
jgi:uncharacterized protein (TIGR02300 family)